MSEICSKCGLPEELCVCETIAKESQKIMLSTVKRKFGKIHTIVEGIDDKNIGLKELVKELKNDLACGGTAKEGKIDLQGNHLKAVKEALIRHGFSPESIETK